jgi:hypothetical protein
MKDRIICSHEKLCGCHHIPKKRKDNDFVVVGEPIINPAMKNCARFISGHSGTKYCCLTREMVHIII